MHGPHVCVCVCESERITVGVFHLTDIEASTYDYPADSLRGHDATDALNSALVNIESVHVLYLPNLFIEYQISYFFRMKCVNSPKRTSLFTRDFLET